MDGSNGKIVELLERIATGQEATRDEVAQLTREVTRISAGLETTRDAVSHIAHGLEGTRSEMRGGLGALRSEMRGGLEAVRSEMREGFAQVNHRLDNILHFTGGHHADHEQRIRALEDEVFKKSG